jgi:hypothetical protein
VIITKWLHAGSMGNLLAVILESISALDAAPSGGL